MSKDNNVSEDIEMTAQTTLLACYRRYALCAMRFASQKMPIRPAGAEEEVHHE